MLNNYSLRTNFLRCDRNVLMHMLKSDSLYCNEVELFDACIAWAGAACQQKNVDATKAENLRAELGDAIYQVRFSSLTIKEFVARHHSIEGFFTPKETNEIMCMMGNLKDFKSDHFNQTKRGMCSNLVECEFECRRIVSARDRNRVYSVCEEPIDFGCSERIKVVGFAITTTFPIDDTGEFRISLKIPPFGLPSFLPTYTLKHSTLEDEVVVCLDEPIEICVSERCYIEMPQFDRFPEPKRLKLRNILANDIEIDDFKFTFSGNFPMITRVFFNRPTDDY